MSAPNEAMPLAALLGIELESAAPEEVHAWRPERLLADSLAGLCAF